MESVIYIAAILASFACTALLLRAYGRTRVQLLLWTGLCFVALTLSNVFLFVDLVVLPEKDLYAWRLGTAFVGVSILLYGFVWESE